MCNVCLVEFGLDEDEDLERESERVLERESELFMGYENERGPEPPTMCILDVPTSNMASQFIFLH